MQPRRSVRACGWACLGALAITSHLACGEDDNGGGGTNDATTSMTSSTVTSSMTSNSTTASSTGGTTSTSTSDTSSSNSASSSTGGAATVDSTTTGSTTTTGGGGGPSTAPNLVLVGSFAPLPDYADATAGGHAVLVRSDDSTTVSVALVGLQPDTDYPAHVHQMPCAQLGGGHYKLDPSIEDTDESNEIWPTFTTDSDGNGMGTVTVDHRARGDALAVVVHDPNADNAKFLCADLTLNGATAPDLSGTFASFGAAAAGDETITGTAALSVGASGTTVTLMVTGLDPAAEYRSHVHALPCGVMDAGGHYKLDPSVEDTVETNELWPSLTPDEAGMASATYMNDHMARMDAQSVVIHRVDGDETPKVACADLIADAYPSVVSSGGELMPFAIASERGYDALTASATLTRTPDGTTQVELTAGGLSAGETYPAHVHALPCAMMDAGGHYKLDTTNGETAEENEIWLPITADETGAAMSSASVTHVARADAQAIVIHDYEDSSKLACIDLD